MNITDRLRWTRSELELEREEVAESIGFSVLQVQKRESGRPVGDFETYHKLAEFYEKCWQNKFACKNYPRLKGVPIKEITLEFLMLGQDKSSTVKTVIIEELKTMLKEQEREFTKREIDLVTEKMALEMRLGL